jgi:hypothetical protein
MKRCAHCQKENPSDFAYCRHCGADLRMVPDSPPAKFWKRLPAWLWIILIVGGIAGIIFAIIGSFIAIATLEGVASMVLLICGIIGFGVAPLRKPEQTAGFTRAIGLSFFALMGATVDQPGNPIYNQPVAWCFCPEGTSLDRDELVSNPLPGTTYIEQEYTCYNQEGVPVKQINVFAVLGIRFIEYVLLGYLLIGLRNVLWRIKNNS